MVRLTSSDLCFICGTPLMYPRDPNPSVPNMIRQCPFCGKQFHKQCLLEALDAAGETLEQCVNPQCSHYHARRTQAGS